MLGSNHVRIDGINVRGVCRRLFVSIMLVAPAAEATDFELRITELERQVRQAATTINFLSPQTSALKRQQEGRNNCISTDVFPPANQGQHNFLTSGLDLGGFYHVAVTGVAGEVEKAT